MTDTTTRTEQRPVYWNEGAGDFPVDSWIDAVNAGSTKLGYEEWYKHQYASMPAPLPNAEDQILLTHTPGSWDGTFGNVLRTLLTDVLMDDDIAAVTEYQMDGGDIRRIGLDIHAVDDNDIIYSDGSRIPLDYVIGVQVG